MDKLQVDNLLLGKNYLKDIVSILIEILDNLILYNYQTHMLLSQAVHYFLCRNGQENTFDFYNKSLDNTKHLMGNLNKKFIVQSLRTYRYCICIDDSTLYLKYMHYLNSMGPSVLYYLLYLLYKNSLPRIKDNLIYCLMVLWYMNY